MNREAQILAAMPTASLAEQRMLAQELEAIRASRRASLRGERDDAVAEAMVTDLLTPAIGFTAHTAATDWMDEVAPGGDATEVHLAAKAEATNWVRRVSAAVKEDADEFVIQAEGYARVWGGQFGLQAAAAKDSFVAQALHLAGFRSLASLTVEAYPKGSASCRSCNRTRSLNRNGYCSECQSNITKQRAVDKKNKEKNHQKYLKAKERKEKAQASEIDDNAPETEKEDELFFDPSIASLVTVADSASQKSRSCKRCGMTRIVNKEGYCRSCAPVMREWGKQRDKEWERNRKRREQRAEKKKNPNPNSHNSGDGDQMWFNPSTASLTVEAEKHVCATCGKPATKYAYQEGARASGHFACDAHIGQWSNGRKVVNASRRTAARKLIDIADEIAMDWKNVDYNAQPYLDAMFFLDSLDDTYIAESGRSIVLYFLNNASGWRGETAKRVKAELRAMLSGKSASRRTAGVYDDAKWVLVDSNGNELMWWMTDEERAEYEEENPNLGGRRWRAITDTERQRENDWYNGRKASRRTAGADTDYESQFVDLTPEQAAELDAQFRNSKDYMSAKEAFMAAARTEGRGIDVAFARVTGPYPMYRVWSGSVTASRRTAGVRIVEETGDTTMWAGAKGEDDYVPFPWTIQTDDGEIIGAFPTRELAEKAFETVSEIDRINNLRPRRKASRRTASIIRQNPDEFEMTCDECGEEHEFSPFRNFTDAQNEGQQDKWVILTDDEDDGVTLAETYCPSCARELGIKKGDMPYWHKESGRRTAATGPNGFWCRYCGDYQSVRNPKEVKAAKEHVKAHEEAGDQPLPSRNGWPDKSVSRQTTAADTGIYCSRCKGQQVVNLGGVWRNCPKCKGSGLNKKVVPKDIMDIVGEGSLHIAGSGYGTAYDNAPREEQIAYSNFVAQGYADSDSAYYAPLDFESWRRGYWDDLKNDTTYAPGMPPMASSFRRRADQGFGPDDNSQSGHAESDLEMVDVENAPEDSNLGWITQGSYRVAAGDFDEDGNIRCANCGQGIDWSERMAGGGGKWFHLGDGSEYCRIPGDYMAKPPQRFASLRTAGRDYDEGYDAGQYPDQTFGEALSAYQSFMSEEEIQAFDLDEFKRGWTDGKNNAGRPGSRFPNSPNMDWLDRQGSRRTVASGWAEDWDNLTQRGYDLTTEKDEDNVVGMDTADQDDYYFLRGFGMTHQQAIKTIRSRGENDLTIFEQFERGLLSTSSLRRQAVWEGTLSPACESGSDGLCDGSTPSGEMCECPCHDQMNPFQTEEDAREWHRESSFRRQADEGFAGNMDGTMPAGATPMIQPGSEPDETAMFEPDELDTPVPSDAADTAGEDYTPTTASLWDNL